MPSPVSFLVRSVDKFLLIRQITHQVFLLTSSQAQRQATRTAQQSKNTSATISVSESGPERRTEELLQSCAPAQRVIKLMKFAVMALSKLTVVF